MQQLYCSSSSSQSCGTDGMRACARGLSWGCCCCLWSWPDSLSGTSGGQAGPHSTCCDCWTPALSHACSSRGSQGANTPASLPSPVCHCRAVNVSSSSWLDPATSVYYCPVLVAAVVLSVVGVLFQFCACQPCQHNASAGVELTVLWLWGSCFFPLAQNCGECRSAVKVSTCNYHLQKE